MQATYLLECDARAEIWGLVVADTARGTGVGRRLVEAAEEWALMRGLAVMAVRSNNLRTEAQGVLRAPRIHGDENAERLSETPHVAEPWATPSR